MSLIQKAGRTRLVRPMANLLAARLAELPLESLRDPRVRRSRWSMRRLLTMVIAGIASGAKGLAEVESLSESLGDGARRLLRLPTRVLDTTLRDVLVRLDVDEIRGLIQRMLEQALRRRQLRHNLPLRVASMDGKHTATWMFDSPEAEVKYGQRQQGRTVVRTITTCLASADGCPCLDAFPSPPKSNEVSAFQMAGAALLERWRGHLDVLMYDAGGRSLGNASWVRSNGLDDVFVLAENQPELMAEARRCLLNSDLTPTVEQVRVEGANVVTRRLFQHTLPSEGGVEGYLGWTHLRTILRVETVRADKGSGRITTENKYYLSSLVVSRLKPDAWLTLLRRRWAVENENHNIWDRILREDDRPFILAPQGMLVVQLLRRLVYNMLTLFRSVTLRAESTRTTPWKELLRAIHLTLTVATVTMLEGLRSRPQATV